MGSKNHMQKENKEQNKIELYIESKSKKLKQKQK